MSDGAGRPFTLDRFQAEAIEHLDRGRSVLVCAPTGSGKTLVAEHAVALAVAAGRRAFYTTPIKALSNQKFRDFGRRFGAERVGLLTGDNSINGDAPVVVMTTEVLRNMLYADADLSDLAVVVIDEVHYLDDPYRGPVWEEVILHLRAGVRLVALSATVSNHAELGAWLRSVRGPTEVVVETERPVELTSLYVVGDRRRRDLHLVPVVVDGRPNPEGHRFDPPRRGPDRGRPRHPWRTPSRLELVDLLEDRHMLPAIWFVFSRRGCDEAAAALARSGVRFTDDEERHRIEQIVDDHTGGLTDAERAVLGITRWRRLVGRGIAAHHAGLVPPVKEAVEACFAAGLVRVVFATETLALGVNLPARSVVIDRLSKFTGEHHEPLTPAQFTQLTGRAGRRGIDEHGHALVPWSPFTTFDQVASLATSRAFHLRSAFRPTYNMTVNLLARRSPGEVRDVLARSFAQFQSDAAVAELEVRLSREREHLAELEATVAERGLPPGPAPELAASRREIADAVSRLRPGDVIADEEGRRLAVLAVSWRKGGRARLRLVDVDATEHRWDLADLHDPPVTLGHLDLPEPFTPARPGYRAEVAHRLARLRLRRPRRRHRPDPADPRRRLELVRRDVEALERRARSRRGSLVRRFDGVCAVLRERGHLEDWTPTPRGRLLARVFHELDICVAEALDAGLFDGLTPAEFAAFASCFTHEHRRPGPPPAPWFPTAEVGRRWEELDAAWATLVRAERRHDVPGTRRPEPGLVPVAQSWASGTDLADLLAADEDLSPGDFVRSMRLLADLLRQLA
ncbi:MAG: DEAD/DEAH box helicase, partial [Actinomyces sp.]